MIVQDLLHLMLGYVSLSAEGGFVERFINLCTAEGIPLWDMHKVGNTLHARTDIEGYKRIRSPARGSGMRVRMVKKCGLPFLTYRYSRRKGFLIGFALMFAVLFFLSGNIWIIEVDGNNITDSQAIIELFEDAGLKIGVRRKKLKTDEIVSRALAESNDFSRAAININGSRAVIEVREILRSPEIEEKENTTANLIASKDGQIQILEPYRGTSAVKLGATVRKGDLLISGTKEDRTETTLFCYAKGYAVASTVIKAEYTQPMTRIELTPQSNRLYTVYFLGKEFPKVPKRNTSQCYTHRSYMTVADKRMPFGIFYRRFTDFVPSEKEISPAEARLTAINNYHLTAYNSTLHAQVISQTVVISQTDTGVKITGEYSCYENIGQTKELSVEESTEQMSELVTVSH